MTQPAPSSNGASPIPIPEPVPPPKGQSLRRRVIITVALAFATLIGLLIYGDFSGIIDSLEDFRWVLLPAILALTLFNYVLRFFKWQYYLRVTGIKGVELWDSVLIFLSALAMTLTPAKLGEWIKSYYLKERYGTPPSLSAPIILAERVTDGYAMLMLSAGGLILVQGSWPFLAVMALLGVLIAVLFRYRPAAEWTVRMARHMPFLRRHADFIEGFYKSAFVLFSPKALIVPVTIGFFSWLGEGIAMYLVLLGLGAENGFDLVVRGVFILSITQVAGAVVFTPGSLGVAEGSIASLTQVLTTLAREAAAAAALLIRICTLWFGVALGLLALMILSRKPSTPVGVPEPAAPVGIPQD